MDQSFEHLTMEGLIERDQDFSLTEIREDGGSTTLELSKNAMMALFNLSPPDFKELDPYFDHSPTIHASGSAIVVCLERVRGIITGNRVLICTNLHGEVIDCIEALKNQFNPAPARPAEAPPEQPVEAAPSESDLLQNLLAETQRNSRPAERPEIKRTEATDGWPFELRALEVLIRIVCHNQQSQIKDMGEKLEEAENKLELNICKKHLKKVREVKGLIPVLDVKILKLKNEIQRLMEANDANGVSVMMSFCLGNRVPENQSRVEKLFYAGFLLCQRALSDLAQLKEMVEDTMDIVSLSMDNSRNRLMRFELLLTIVGFVCTILSILIGVLGLYFAVASGNIHDMFKWDMTGMVVVAIFLLFGLMYYVRLSRGMRPLWE